MNNPVLAKHPGNHPPRGFISKLVFGFTMTNKAKFVIICKIIDFPVFINILSITTLCIQLISNRHEKQ